MKYDDLFFAGRYNFFTDCVEWYFLPKTEIKVFLKKMDIRGFGWRPSIYIYIYIYIYIIYVLLLYICYYYILYIQKRKLHMLPCRQKTNTISITTFFWIDLLIDNDNDNKIDSFRHQ